MESILQPDKLLRPDHGDEAKATEDEDSIVVSRELPNWEFLSALNAPGRRLSKSHG